MSLEEADDAHEGIDTFDEFSGHFRTVPSDYGHLHPLSHGFVRFRPLTFVFRRFSPTLDVYVCFPAFPSNFENSYVRFRSVPSDLRHDVIFIWRGPRFVLGRFGPIFDLRGSTRIVDWEQTMGIQHGGMFGEECWKIIHFYYDFKTWKRTLLKLLFSWKLCFSSVWSYMYEGMVTGMYN